MPPGSGPSHLADKRAPVIESYSFGLSSSSYLNYREGGRIKISDQLNHHRANLMKIVFAAESVQVIEPEVDLLSFFQKDDGKYGRIYNIVPSDSFEEELRCGDLIRAGNTELLVREIVDGRDRVRYKGSNRSIQLEAESILDGSVFNLDGDQCFDSNDRSNSCKMCREGSSLDNPLIYPCPSSAVCYCRRCLDKHIKNNTTIKRQAAGVMHFIISNLFDSKSGAEFMRFVSGESGTSHELISFKQFYCSSQAIILEKVLTNDKKGQVEGWILLYDSDTSCLPEGEPTLFGTSALCQVVLQDGSMEPIHFAITMNESKYYISDSKSQQYTYLRKQSKNKLDILKTTELFCLHDHLIRLTRVREDQAVTTPENRCSRFDLYEHRGYTEADKNHAESIEDKYFSSSGSENSNKLESAVHADFIYQNREVDEPLRPEDRMVSIGPHSKVGIGKSYLRPLTKSQIASEKRIPMKE